MQGPSPFDRHPMNGFPQVGFIKPLVKNPNISVGDYSYYDDPEGPEHFEARCVLYHFPFIGDKLIGKFCALARGVRFIMNGANHLLSGFSTYPFYIFGMAGSRLRRSRTICLTRAIRSSETTSGSGTMCW